MMYKKIKSSQLGEVDYMLYKFILESIYRVNKEVKITIRQSDNNNTVFFIVKYKNYVLAITSKENELLLYRYNIISQTFYDRISLNYSINWTQSMVKALIDLQIQIMAI